MEGYTKILLGAITEEELINVVREVKELWRYSQNIWPQGNRKLVPDIQATRDKSGQYSVWMNAQALTYLLLRCKNIPPIDLTSKTRDAETPMPPDFLNYPSKSVLG